MSAPDPELARDLREGLTATPKRLPPYLFYDAAGSALYEEITRLPEYYPTRTERAILAAHANEIIARAAGDAVALHVVELGAGSAEKTTLLLRALVARQGGGVYLPVDVSGTALRAARERIEAEVPAVRVRPFEGRHLDAVGRIRALGPRRLVMFIGSSIGNYDDRDAAALLRGVREGLAPGCALLLGTDLRKSPSVLVPAYDDAAGVTAAFNKNVLARINRELGGRFALDRFAHVALWNDAASRVEMHLESLCAQTIPIEALGITVHLDAGERIHTESSVKYDLPRVDAILGAAGFAREQSFADPAGLFAVHLARSCAPSHSPSQGLWRTP